jgi:hypothetical protein
MLSLSGYATTTVGFAFCGAGFFFTYLVQIAGVRFKSRMGLYPRLLGGVLLAMFALQVAAAVQHHDVIPLWALVTGLVGSTFGLAAGALIFWCAHVNRKEEA